MGTMSKPFIRFVLPSLVFLISTFIIISPVTAQVTLVSGTTQSGKEGQSAEFRFSATNSRSASETVDVNTDIDWDHQLSSTSFRLLAGESRDVIMTIDIPDDSAPMTKAFQVSFTETSLMGSQDTKFDLEIMVVRGTNQSISEDLIMPLMRGGFQSTFETGISLAYGLWLLIAIIVSGVGSMVIQGRASPGKTPDRRAIHLLFANYFARSGISFVSFYIPLMFIWVLLGTPEWFTRDAWIFLVLGILLCALMGALWARLYFRSYSYSFEDDGLSIKRGIIFSGTIIIPYSKIQNLNVRTSPLSRLFGLSYVDVETAGTSNMIGARTLADTVLGTTTDGVLIGIRKPDEVVGLLKGKMKEAGQTSQISKSVP
jgi:membrane protein YdbS with pleckstrin-like domain